MNGTVLQKYMILKKSPDITDALQKWKDWLHYIETLDVLNETVIVEINRAKKIIEVQERLENAPAFLTSEAWKSFSEYELSGEPVVSGNPEGVKLKFKK